MIARQSSSITRFAHRAHCLLLSLVLVVPSLAVAAVAPVESLGEQEESRTIVAEGCPTCVRRPASLDPAATATLYSAWLDGNHQTAATYIDVPSARRESPYSQSNPPRLF